MIKLKSSIYAVEKLLNENSDASLTYAALECRLAIELICYERLRLAHDYISHDDLKKWQPREIVNTLIQEVDSEAASTFTLSISKESRLDGVPEPTLENIMKLSLSLLGRKLVLIQINWVSFGTPWQSSRFISVYLLAKMIMLPVMGIPKKSGQRFWRH